ncbi:MAG: hypothetical protein AKCLJLPJ_01321 [Fimbriimonadales bacterium]|nr:MAG: DUF1844 domain-containing protein [Armatimonadota bacterium]MBV6503254.1 hypothetical protein [Fimbriimonadales bacterium]MCE7900587.1 DUF1844 domain-containing protein [Armatimonadetes bacterium ATM1]MDL1929360.1 DUF1844 domain-containing protein [Fimbriimonadia bacterium ATM]MBC6970184.1 DUF1844 domain-containing protein [Armatimonadota bacterium]
MEREEKEEKQPEPVSVYDLVASALYALVDIAWVKMGLQPDPLTRQPATDMAEARLAIDVAAQLAEALDPKLTDDERRQIQALLSNLRINFVRQKDAQPKDEGSEA